MLVNHSAFCSDLQIPVLYSVCVVRFCESHYQLYKCTLIMYVRSQGLNQQQFVLALSKISVGRLALLSPSTNTSHSAVFFNLFLSFCTPTSCRVFFLLGLCCGGGFLLFSVLSGDQQQGYRDPREGESLYFNALILLLMHALLMLFNKTTEKNPIIAQIFLFLLRNLCHISVTKDIVLSCSMGGLD